MNETPLSALGYNSPKRSFAALATKPIRSTDDSRWMMPMPMKQDFDKYQEGDPLDPQSVPEGIVISSDTRRAQRVPPGQARTRKWPILHYGRVPVIPTDQWELRVHGLVENELHLNWSEFQALPRSKVFSDIHCVTRWSRLGNLWDGVATSEIMKRARPKPGAACVVVHGYDDGWTTNLSLRDFLSPDALFADRHDGEPLSADHGGPVRLVVPLLYFWKSAKWPRAIEVIEKDRLGYWEKVGYHHRGDPWREERYSDS